MMAESFVEGFCSEAEPSDGIVFREPRMRPVGDAGSERFALLPQANRHYVARRGIIQPGRAA